MESIAGIAVQPRAERAAALPWYLSALLLGSTSIVVGLLWDISWHMSIGRDTFWTPAHMAIYLGGVLAGISGGWLALRTTFRGTPEETGVAVRFWGFRAPLGAWVAIWGALAMLTSAPFDDWWHNAYGLDVKIISPPHTVLAARHDRHPDRHDAARPGLAEPGAGGAGPAAGARLRLRRRGDPPDGRHLPLGVRLSERSARGSLLQGHGGGLPGAPGGGGAGLAPALGGHPRRRPPTCRSPSSWSGSCRSSRRSRCSRRSTTRSTTWCRRCSRCC